MSHFATTSASASPGRGPQSVLGKDSIPRSASVYSKAGYIHHTFSIRVVFGGFRVYSMGNCDIIWFGFVDRL